MEALERRGRHLAIAAIVFIMFWSQCPVVSAKMSYVCPPHFLRLGYSCYYFSEEAKNWQQSLFACKERGSDLSVPARWEDRNLRKHLNKLPKSTNESRWIGGIYDDMSRAWKWGGELRTMHYQSFSKMKKMTPEELKFHCIAMIPKLLYRWQPLSCTERHMYICQTKLKKIPKSKIKNYKRQWNEEINEITAPSASKEVNDPMSKDITVNPDFYKSYDVHGKAPSQLRMLPKRKAGRHNNGTTTYLVRPKKRQRPQRPTVPRRSRLTRPFPGYRWDRRDPEGSYRRNEQILLSGRLHLTQQQINSHLARLRHVRDRQLRLARQKRLRDHSDWLENDTRPALAYSHPKTYTVDNNISALHPKTIVEEFDMPMPVPVVRARRVVG